MGDKIERIRRTYEIGDKVIFLKSGQECTVIGYSQQYNKLLSHKNRLLVCPDSGLKRSKQPEKPVRQAEKLFAHGIPNETSLPIMKAVYPPLCCDEAKEQVEVPMEAQPVADTPKEENVKPKRRRKKKSDVLAVQEGDETGTEDTKQ